jgi:cold shock CspA family protein/ribosome-associated translation inhibitor RaiA
MPPQTHVTFRGFDPSEPIASYVRERSDKLDTFYGRILSLWVAVESPHRHHHQGRTYRVRIDVVVPGAELVAGSAPRTDDRHMDVYAAVDDAFDDAGRVLSDFAGRRRGYAKPHAGSRRGWVTRLFRELGYGFLETAEGEELYFHRNSVLAPGFAKLSVGSQVRFADEIGEKGPQASTVAIVRRRERAARPRAF